MKNIFEKILRYIIYSLIFVFPIIFLPFTIFPINQGKQFVLTIVCLLLFILWLIKILVSGKLRFNFTRLSLGIILLLISFSLSFAFSGNLKHSFWGMNYEIDSYFNLLIYGLFFFLCANLLKDNNLEESKPKEYRNIKKAIYAFLGGAGFLAILFLIQIISQKSLFNFEFSNTIGFNPLGSLEALAVFLGSAFLTVVTMASFYRIDVSRKGKSNLVRIFLPTVNLILALCLFISIILLNYWIVWLGIAIGMLLIIAQRMRDLDSEKKNLRLQNILLPFSILSISLVLIFIKVPFQSMLNIPQEVNISQGASYDVAAQSFVSSTKNLIIGSGPATFGYQYSLYRPLSLNMIDLWNIRFNQGSNVISTVMTISGILGLLTLSFIIFDILIRIKKFIMDRGKASHLETVVLIICFYFVFLWLFFPFNEGAWFLTMMFFAFLAIIDSFNLKRKKLKEFSFSFNSSPQKAFLVMILCIFLVVGSALGIFHLIQKYIAGVAYAEGIESIKNEDFSQGILSIRRASEIDKIDFYFRNLSQALMLRLEEILSDEEMEQSEKDTMIMELINDIDVSLVAATTANPRDSQNWTNAATIYEKLYNYGVDIAASSAILSYNDALELDPRNPEINLAVGRIYQKLAINLEEPGPNSSEEEKAEYDEKYNEAMDAALSSFEKAIELKSNYTSAYLWLANNYETRGEMQKAIETYQKILIYEPDNQDVIDKIESLK